MKNKWKKGLNKVGDITSKVFNKGKDMVSVNSHKNHINDCYKDIGAVVYDLYKKNEVSISIHNGKIKSILEDIDYRNKKIDELKEDRES